MSKERLDVLLVNKGLQTREKAKTILCLAMYMLTGRRKTRQVSHTAVIEVRGTTLKYVSCHSKLEKAMQNFDVTLECNWSCRFING